jgi:hypothetical protein
MKQHGEHEHRRLCQIALRIGVPVMSSSNAHPMPCLLRTMCRHPPAGKRAKAGRFSSWFSCIACITDERTSIVQDVVCCASWLRWVPVSEASVGEIGDQVFRHMKGYPR